MSITHEAYLNIVPGDSPAPIIKVSQYDADFSIVFHLIAKKRGIVPAYPRTVENDEDVTINVPTSATVSVRGTKTDGNGYSAAATLSGTATAPIVTVAGHEQMTASAGVNVYEITFYAADATKRLSTANFILFVEPAALDASTITSESLMLELNDLIAAVPNAVAAADRAEAAVQSVEGVTTQVATNTQDISDIKADLSEIVPGLSEDAKATLLNCFRHVAWSDAYGQRYYDNLYDALYPNSSLVRISAVFTQGSAIIYPDTPLNDLKAYLFVTGYYNDGTSKAVNDYALSGELTVGTSTITVSIGKVTTTFTVTVSAPYWDYNWRASSKTLPDGMTAREYDFATENGAMWVNFSNLDFDFTGNCIIEITAKEYVKNTSGEMLYSFWNNPQIMIKNVIKGENSYQGIKMIFNSALGTSTTHGNLSIGINGVNSFVESVNTSEYHTYKIQAQNNTYTVWIDDELVTLEQNDLATQYLDHTGIDTNSDISDQICGLFIKDIKFKRL